MRGKQTEPGLKEEAISIATITGNKLEASRQTGLPNSTIHGLLKDDEFEEFRQQVQKEYIVKTWNNILTIEEALAKKITEEDINKLNLRELTGALRDLKQTVENVVNNITNNFTQNNLNINISDTEMLEEALDVLSERSGKTIEEIKIWAKL